LLADQFPFAVDSLRDALKVVFVKRSHPLGVRGIEIRFQRLRYRVFRLPRLTSAHRRGLHEYILPLASALSCAGRFFVIVLRTFEASGGDRR
jgi:hypothetical protein